MKTTTLKSFCSLILMTFVLSASAQTITLTPDAELDVNAGPCTEIAPGTTLTFDRSALCDEDILITTTDNPPVELLQSSDAVVTYTFATAGNFVVFCGAPNSPTNVAVQAICVNVDAANASSAIPTLGEWSLIFLILLAMIIGITVLRQSKSVTSKAN